MIEQSFLLYTSNIPQSVKEKDEFCKYADKIGLNYELIESYTPTETEKECEEIISRDLPFLLPLEKNLRKHILRGGTMSCTLSHIKMWKMVAESNKTTAIFEHDARPLIEFEDLEIPDEIGIFLLGPRVTDINQYTPPRKVDKIFQVHHHAGAHAYIINPKTANALIDYFRINGVHDDVDNTVFMRLKSNHRIKTIPLYALDPPPVVAEVGIDGVNKDSTIKRSSDNGKTSSQNFYILDGFREGLK